MQHRSPKLLASTRRSEQSAVPILRTGAKMQKRTSPSQMNLSSTTPRSICRGRPVRRRCRSHQLVMSTSRVVGTTSLTTLSAQLKPSNPTLVCISRVSSVRRSCLNLLDTQINGQAQHRITRGRSEKRSQAASEAKFHRRNVGTMSP